jgi:hypothetical protein
MHIFRINKSGSGSSSTRRLSHNAIKNSHRKMVMGGSANAEKVFEDNALRKATDNLRNLKISKPRIPKKYITFE